MPRLPKISVNIPLISRGNIKPVLDTLQKVDYPKDLIEIVVVEGAHIGKQRNIAIKHSHGEIVYLLDDDSEVRSDAFKILAKEFKNKKVAAVGGPSLTKKDGNYLNFLIGCALETYFGALRMRFRYSEQNQSKEGSEYHLIGANLALRKKTVEKVGMFNEKVVPNEETELLRRLKWAGYSLIYKKELSIRRSHRKTVTGLAKQFHHYGVGRMKQILYNGSFEDLLFIIPSGFALYLISLYFFHPLWYFLPLVLYLLLAFTTSVKAALKYRKVDLFFILPLVFITTHISYALGIMHEALNQSIFKKVEKRQSNRFKVKVLSLNPLER